MDNRVRVGGPFHWVRELNLSRNVGEDDRLIRGSPSRTAMFYAL